MRGKGCRILDPTIMPLDLALELPLLGQVNGCGTHSFVLRIRDDELLELFPARRRRGFPRGGLGCRNRFWFSLGGRSRNARRNCGSAWRSRGIAGRRTATWVRRQTGGLFALIGQRVLVFLEAGHDSAPTRLHSRAQPLCIACAGGLNRSK